MASHPRKLILTVTEFLFEEPSRYHTPRWKALGNYTSILVRRAKEQVEYSVEMLQWIPHSWLQWHGKFHSWSIPYCRICRPCIPSYSKFKVYASQSVSLQVRATWFPQLWVYGDLSGLFSLHTNTFVLITVLCRYILAQLLGFKSKKICLPALSTS
jgi:hypothetical protein